MKKLLLILFLSPMNANANLWKEIKESFYFEPTILCVGGAAAGSTMGDSSQRDTNMAIGCLAGAIVGYMINDYYSDKFKSEYDEEISKYKNIIDERRKVEAYKAAKGEDFEFAVKVREIVPAQKLPNGEVRAPTVKEKLILINDDMFVGE